MTVIREQVRFLAWCARKRILPAGAVMVHGLQDKILVVLVTGVLCVCLAEPVASRAAGVPAQPPDVVADLAKYTKAEGTSAEKVTVVNAGFNSGAEGWNLPESWRVDPTGGRSGTGSLFYGRTDPAEYSVASQTVALRPGMRYTVGVWIKQEDIKGENPPQAVIGVEFYKGGQWIAGVSIYPQGGSKSTKDWTYVSGTGTVPETADTEVIVLYFNHGLTGKVWFDDVSIEPAAPKWVAYLLGACFEMIPADAGRIEISSWYQTPGKVVVDTVMACRLEVLRNGRSLFDHIRPVRNGRVTADVGHLPEGPATIRLTLLDTTNKRILGEQTLPVTVVPAARPLPANACVIDRKGRAIVDGKPFLPVGLYLYKPTREDLDRIAKGSFNCIMPYESLVLSFDPNGKSNGQTIREVMDACYEKRIKVIFGIEVFTDKLRLSREWLGAKGGQAIAAKAVSLLQDHPALLAWYLYDEVSLDMLPEMVANRRMMNRLDPFHPTWGVFYNSNELMFYGSTCDVLGFDPYPIENAESRDMKMVQFAMDMAGRTYGTGEDMPALWMVPQVFNWGTYRAKDPESYRKDFRDPTEEEMRSMALLMALRGAKGFIFYSYHDLVRPNRWPNPDKEVWAADFGRRWPEVCRVSEMLTSLAPFLLSDRSGPGVTVQTEAGTVQARGFSDDHGRIRVLVAGVGPAKSRALITPDCKVSLKSRYGHCAVLGDGRYRFEGNDICSDILEEDGKGGTRQ